jgi:hypothetical protein
MFCGIDWPCPLPEPIPPQASRTTAINQLDHRGRSAAARGDNEDALGLARQANARLTDFANLICVAIFFV